MPDAASSDAEPSAEEDEEEEEEEEEEGVAAVNGATKEAVTAPLIGGFADTVSLLDVRSLADIIRKFHDEVDSFVRRESEKLFEQEARNQQARRSFQEIYDAVRGFLVEFSVGGGRLESKNGDAQDNGGASSKGQQADSADDGSAGDDDEEGEDEAAPGESRKQGGVATSSDPDSACDSFSKRLLPNFVRCVTDDRRAMQDAGELLGTFVQQHFRSSKELTTLLSKPSPVPLFRALLRALVAELSPGRPEQKGGGGGGGSSSSSAAAGKRGGEKGDKGGREDRKGRTNCRDQSGSDRGGARDRRAKRGRSCSDSSSPDASRDGRAGRSRSRGR